MVIDRTYHGSRTEYNSRSHYFGFTDTSNGFHVIIGGEVCNDKMCEVDPESAEGKFVLTMVGDNKPRSTRSRRKTEVDTLFY